MAKLKITIPEDISDITLEQFQKYVKIVERDDLTELESDRRIISIFSGIPYNKIKNVAEKDYQSLKQDIIKALNKDAKFEPRFMLNGREWGFEPNLDGISGGHNADLLEYHSDNDQLHRYVACLFRPITGKDKFGNYEIETYNGTAEHSQELKQMPLHIYKGANVFFSSLANELLSSTQKFIRKELMKAQRKTISVNGDGTQPLPS